MPTVAITIEMMTVTGTADVASVKKPFKSDTPAPSHDVWQSMIIQDPETKLCPSAGKTTAQKGTSS